MINLYSRRTNTITISDLYSKVTIPDASLHYVFNFVDVYNNEVPAVLVQQNADQTRSSKFYFTDSSDGTIKGSGEYNIYESPIDSSVIDASIMNLLENGQYTYVPETDADLYYDPSLFDYLGHDVVFDPIFGSGDQVPTTVNHDDLTGRDSKSNHPWALAEASLGTQFSWESGLLTVDVSGGSSTKDPSIDDLYSEISDINSYQSIQDSSIAALEASIGNSMDYPYVDGSLAERDASIEALFVLSETQDPSIADLYQEIEDIPQDPSIISLYDTKQDIITDGTFLKESSIGSGFEWNAGMLDVPAGSGDVTQAYVDGSLAERDTSIAWLDTNKLEQSDLADYTTFDYVDGSLNAKADIGDIPTDFYSQEYVDGSLNAKQDSIPDGTFLKEASLGTDFVWNAGVLDVSIVSTDASVQDLYDYVEDLSTYAHTQDASIADLYQEIEDIPQDPSIVDIYDTAMFGITNGLGGDADLLSVDTGPSGLSVVKGKSIKAGPGISVFTDTGIDYIEIENIAVPDVDKSYIDANFIPNASIGEGLVWNAGMLDVSVEGSGGVSQEYVDGSLNTRDIEIARIDSSVSSIKNNFTRALIDSYEGYDLTAGVGPAISGGRYTYMYGLKDSSTIRITDNTEGGVTASFMTFDVSMAQDSSIADLYTSIADLYTIKIDSSDVYSKEYIDGSLNTKLFAVTTSGQGTSLVNHSGQIGVAILKGLSGGSNIKITSGSWDLTIDSSGLLKESSIGEGLVWNAGMLDVSVASSGGDFLPLHEITALPGSGDLKSYESLLNTASQQTSWRLRLADTSTYFVFQDGMWNRFNVISKSGSSFALINQPTSGPTTSRILYDSADTYVDANFIPNASIGEGLFWVDGMLDVSVAGESTTQDASIADLYTEIENIDPSGNYVPIERIDEFTYNTRLYPGDNTVANWTLRLNDASADMVFSNDGGKGNFYIRSRYPEISLVTWNASGVATGVNRNISPSVDTYVDANFVPNASIGAGLFWVDGMLDVSVAGDSGVSQEYIDGSLAERDTSIAWLDTNKLEASDLAAYATIANVDSSISDVYTFIGNLPQDASIADLYQEIADLPQDASIANLYSVKASKTDVDTSLGLMVPKAGATMTGALVAADHGTATNDEVVNVCYGTSKTPPTASTTTIGTIYIQYTA